MLKRSLRFKGYVFAESMIALSMMTTVIGGLLSANSFLFGKATALNERLAMRRVLYEEVRYYERYESASEQRITREGKHYVVMIIQNENKLIKAEIRNEAETFIIELK